MAVVPTSWGDPKSHHSTYISLGRRKTIHRRFIRIIQPRTFLKEITRPLNTKSASSYDLTMAQPLCNRFIFLSLNSLTRYKNSFHSINEQFIDPPTNPPLKTIQHTETIIKNPQSFASQTNPSRTSQLSKHSTQSHTTHHMAIFQLSDPTVQPLGMPPNFYAETTEPYIRYSPCHKSCRLDYLHNIELYYSTI